MQTALMALTAEFTTDAWRSLGGPVMQALAIEQGLRITAEALVPIDSASLLRTLRDVIRQGCQVILLLGADGYTEVLASALAGLPHTPLPDGIRYQLEGAKLMVFPGAADQGEQWVSIIPGALQ